MFSRAWDRRYVESRQPTVRWLGLAGWPSGMVWQSSRAACATLMSPTSPRLVVNNRPRFILDLNERSDAADRAALGARGIRAIGPSRTRCTRRSKRPSSAVAGPMRHVDFETEPRLERIFAQMRTRGARRCARRLAGRARPEAHRFHGGADYFIASRTTLVAVALWARASTIVTVQAPRVTRRRSRIVIVARPWSTRP